MSPFIHSVSVKSNVGGTDFRNPDDPEDKRFEPHHTDFPFVELEYPNNNAREVFPLLVPKDEDHYSPVLEVKKSLFTIIEGQFPAFRFPSQVNLCLSSVFDTQTS